MENILYSFRKIKPQPPLMALSTPTQFLDQPKVLLVEDNALAAIAGKIMLESLGCEVILAETGEDGLEKFSDQLQAVVLDIDLPDISGIEIAKTIRKNNSKIPLIACTSSYRFSEEDYFQAGFNLVLEKPMRLEKIYVCLASYLQQRVH